MLCGRYFGFPPLHKKVNKVLQRWRVLAFYRIAPCLRTNEVKTVWAIDFRNLSFCRAIQIPGFYLWRLALSHKSSRIILIKLQLTGEPRLIIKFYHMSRRLEIPWDLKDLIRPFRQRKVGRVGNNDKLYLCLTYFNSITITMITMNCCWGAHRGDAGLLYYWLIVMSVKCLCRPPTVTSLGRLLVYRDCLRTRFGCRSCPGAVRR